MAYFDHEKLKVYQLAVEFVAWSEVLCSELPKRGAVADQLDRASTSIPLNIAEGNGKFTGPDRCRFFDFARGSSLESAACLDVLVARKRCSAERVVHGKELLVQIVSMLVGLIKHHSDRVCESRSVYAFPDITDAPDGFVGDAVSVPE